MYVRMLEEFSESRRVLLITHVASTNYTYFATNIGHHVASLLDAF